MKAAAKILAELAARNITPVSTNGKLALRGAPDRITPEIVGRVREHKADLLAHLQTEQARVEALATLERMKTFILPSGRIPVAREIAQRLSGAPFLDLDCANYVEIRDALRVIEAELISLGAGPDPELARAAEMVTASFPNARLVSVR
jgi:TubC N-terminal docking domain